MSKKAKIAVVGVVVLVLAGVGGWFLHSWMVSKDYDNAWSGYEKEVKAWADVSERYQVLGPVCGELAGEAECNDLKATGEEATKTAENLSLDLKKAKSASSEETQKLEKAAKEIKAEREKLEQVVEKVEKSAEKTVSEKIVSALEEAQTKADEALSHAGELSGKVADETVLVTLKESADSLSVACKKWQMAPSGHEAVQAYIELKKLVRQLDEATNNANSSHEQWQKEEDERQAQEKRAACEAKRQSGNWTMQEIDAMVLAYAHAKGIRNIMNADEGFAELNTDENFSHKTADVSLWHNDPSAGSVHELMGWIDMEKLIYYEATCLGETGNNMYPNGHPGGYPASCRAPIDFKPYAPSCN